MQPSAVPLRGVKFFSTTASITCRGPSGATYQFFNKQESSPVYHPADIANFRQRADVFEEGTPSPAQIAAGQQAKPRSYQTTGRRSIDPMLLIPPTEEELRAAEERRQLYERSLQRSAEQEAAVATAVTGIGTERAQAERAVQAKAAAGIFEDRPQPPPRSDAFGSRPQPRPTASRPRPIAPEPDEVQPAVAAPVEEFACEFCGKRFLKKQGLSMHQRRHCKKNPNSAANSQ